MKAFKDLLYIIGIYLIGRVSPLNQAELMKHWAKDLEKEEGIKFIRSMK